MFATLTPLWTDIPWYSDAQICVKDLGKSPSQLSVAKEVIQEHVLAARVGGTST